MVDIADLRWPDAFAPSLNAVQWQPTGDGGYRNVGGDLPGVLVTTYTTRGMGWADGHGLIWQVSGVQAATFTIQSGYTVLRWDLGTFWDWSTGTAVADGMLVTWRWWHAEPADLDAGGPGVSGSGQVRLPGQPRLRVRRDGAVAVAEYADADVWRPLFTTGDLGGFIAGPDGWYVYVYDIVGGLWQSIAGFPTSTLYQCVDGASTVLVGTTDQPLSQRMPDGSWRNWPGAGQPLYQCQPDGTLRVVVGG